MTQKSIIHTSVFCVYSFSVAVSFKGVFPPACLVTYLCIENNKPSSENAIIMLNNINTNKLKRLVQGTLDLHDQTSLVQEIPPLCNSEFSVLNAFH